MERQEPRVGWRQTESAGERSWERRKRTPERKKPQERSLIFIKSLLSFLSADVEAEGIDGRGGGGFDGDFVADAKARGELVGEKELFDSVERDLVAARGEAHAHGCGIQRQEA
jgi:hypothetical protein